MPSLVNKINTVLVAVRTCHQIGIRYFPCKRLEHKKITVNIYIKIYTIYNNILCGEGGM